MTEDRKPKREQKPKRVIYINAKLACKRCPVEWMVVDLNPEHKVVKCPSCGEPNDIREAIKRAA
jgi:transcription elongation factor Elf1